MQTQHPPNLCTVNKAAFLVMELMSPNQKLIWGQYTALFVIRVLIYLLYGCVSVQGNAPMYQSI